MKKLYPMINVENTKNLGFLFITCMLGFLICAAFNGVIQMTWSFLGFLLLV